MDRRRSWLNPKWYIANLGSELIAGCPWDDNSFTVELVDEDDDGPYCSVCGVSCLDRGGWDLPPGFMCLEHGDQWREDHPDPPRPQWKKMWDRIDSRLDSLYWKYAARFGQQHQLPPVDLRTHSN